MTYYYLKQKVSLGDIIDFKGLKVEVTDNLIKSNPELFAVEEEKYPEYVECIYSYSDNFTKGKIYTWPNPKDDVGKKRNILPNNFKGGVWGFKPSTKEAFDRQELLEEAKRRYPAGTRFKNANFRALYGNKKDAVKELVWNSLTYDGIYSKPYGNDGAGYVYFRGEWAEVIKPIFKTEDGIDIYEGDEYYSVCKKTFKLADFGAPQSNGAASSTEFWLTFSTKEAAEDWLAKNKPKDLQYYEDLLLNNKFAAGPINNLINLSDMYTCLKITNPKLYWLKVLELIQQDLDEGWKPDWANSGQLKFRISCRYADTVYEVTNNYEFVEGFVYFKTRQSAEKAIDVLKDKLDIIFK